MTPLTVVGQTWMMNRMSEERSARALATMLIVMFGGAALLALSTPLLPDHSLTIALFAALPIAAVRCATEVLENDDD